MTNLPTLIEAEIDTMVDTVAHWVDHVGAVLTSDAGHLLLRNQIRKMLREGAIETLKVVTAAEQGHQDADFALRELGAEMLDRGEMPQRNLTKLSGQGAGDGTGPLPARTKHCRHMGARHRHCRHGGDGEDALAIPDGHPQPRHQAAQRLAPLWPSPCVNAGTHSLNGRSSASLGPQQAWRGGCPHQWSPFDADDISPKKWVPRNSN